MQIEVRIPEHIWNITEIKIIYDAEEKVGDEFEDHMQEVEDNLHVSTSRLSGIERREEILGIKPLDTDSLEDRRLRVALKWNEMVPYTIRVLRQRLDGALGRGNYSLLIDGDNEVLICSVELTRKAMFNAVVELLEDLVPLNYILDIRLRYNPYELVGQFTFEELKKYTCEGVREEVLMHG